jgi:hypothetical protein
MPCHKLVLLCKNVLPQYLEMARVLGKQVGGYSRYIDLRKTEERLPVRLYCGGIYNGINKLQFDDEIANLGLTRIREIVRTICGTLRGVRISRVDWCIDIGIPLLHLALYCRLGRAQNCTVVHSRTGPTFYLRFSNACTIYMYDKRRQLEAKGDPIAKKFHLVGPWTRIEVQYKGGGLPFRKFRNIKRYAELDMLGDISFWEAGRIPDGSSPMQSLAAEGLLRKIDEVGLQMALKGFPSQERANVVKKFLRPASESKFPDLNELMRKRVREWVSNVIRFPRLRPRSRR